MNLTFERQIGGHYRLQVVKKGEVKQDTGWFKNLITTRGLNRYFDNSTSIDTWYCIVGAGNTPPAPEDVSLVAPVSPLTNNTDSGSRIVSYWFNDRPGELPHYNSVTQKFIFLAGEATGNIAEVGVTFKIVDQDELCSRALVLGQDGNPTVVTVLADEELHVYYEIRHYFPDATAPINHGTFDADGVTTTIESLPYYMKGAQQYRNYFMHGSAYGDTNTLFADWQEIYYDFLDPTDGYAGASAFSNSYASAIQEGDPEYFHDTVNTQSVLTFEFPTSHNINNKNIGMYFLILCEGSYSNAEAIPGWQIRLNPPLTKDPLFKLVFTITIKLTEYTP